MTVHGQDVDFAGARYEYLEERASWQGLLIDSGLSRWHEREREDPLLGYVVVVAIHPLDHRVRGPAGQPVQLRFEEWWSRAGVEGVEHQRGNALIKCHYHAMVGERRLRYCYDPVGYPSAPTHWHPPSAAGEHRSHSHCPAEEALERFERFVFQELAARHIA